MHRVLLIVLLLSALLTAPAAAQDDSCGGALPPRLTPGREARVSFTDGSPLNMRMGDHISASIYAKIPEGDVFDVIGLPRCNDGIFWYPMSYVGEKGWIAESVDGEYLVEPAGGVARLFDVLPQDAVLAAQIDGATYALLNRELSPLLEITPSEGDAFPTLPLGEEAIIQGDALYLLSAVSRGTVAAIAYRADGAPIVFREPGHVGPPVGFLPAPDHSSVAWLYDTTTYVRENGLCDLNCAGRAYLLIDRFSDEVITYDDDAWGDRPLAMFETPEESIHVMLQRWTDTGRIVFTSHRAGDEKSGYPIQGGLASWLTPDGQRYIQFQPVERLDIPEVVSSEWRYVGFGTDAESLVTVFDTFTDMSWSVPANGAAAAALSFSPSDRYFAYSALIMEGTAVAQSEVWIYDTQTGENTLLARLDRHPIQDPPPYSYVSAWLSDDLPVLTHGDTFSVVQLSTGATVFIDRVYTALGDEGRPVQRFVGALGSAN
jgi:hypothetical protein